MTKEDKELVFKDLSARIPYHVRVKIWLKDGTSEEGPLDLQHNYEDVLRAAFYSKKIINIKPYLRPMSSMTEEEQQKYYDLTHQEDDDIWAKCLFDKMVDFCNEHHLDYRGLIEKGLALEAPKGMYKKH